MNKWFLLAVLSMCFGILKAQQSEWDTYYEQSNYLETPRYDKTIEYCKKLADYSDCIRYEIFGQSTQGRDLPVLIIDKNQNFTPESIRESGNAILLIEACIHPGESEGKDAGLMLIRDILVFNKYADLLENTSILFIPIFNADGHERFSAFSRINQNGPKEMGWRTTAENYNLNRDFTKADAPEMQDWHALFNRWLPDMFVDIHTTDGADYQYQLTYAMHIMGDMNQEQTDWQNEYLFSIEKKLKQDEILMFPYVSYRTWHDPRSGLIRKTYSPRYSTGYLAMQNRPALLVETHMLKNYKTRVDATYHLLKHTIKYTDENYQTLKKINQRADEEAGKLAGKDFVLTYYTSKKDSTNVLFKGVEYDIVHSDLTDGMWVQFSDKPIDYKLVLFDKLKESKKVKLPDAYIIPAQWYHVINKLKLHGIQYTTLEESKEFTIRTYKFSNITFANFPYEGRQMVRGFDVEELSIIQNYPAGSAIVPVNQRSAKIIAHLLEPEGPDSFLRWGFFNSIFERKEYVETYVMEKMAREMIQENPQLLKDFQQALKEHPDVYNNQWAKVNWFLERSAYRDRLKNMYPIGKIYNAEF
jgi:murein tripeptide amidase MpaA